MPNALSSISGGPPPAPDPKSSALSESMPVSQAPAPAAGPAQPQQPEMPPPPSHRQTVAALRHFGMISEELRSVLNNPDCGKADMRSEIIDGTSRLVADGVLSPGDAVKELGSVPDRPYDQKAWLEKMLADSQQASMLVLAHHQMGFAGQNIPENDAYDPAQHANTMSGVMSLYRGKNA